MSTSLSNHRRGGFTLLELLVVIAILAILAGTMVATYDGLEDRAVDSAISYNIKGVDQTIRQFASINKTSPNTWDSLLFSSDGTGSDGEFLNILSEEFTEHLGTTTPSALTALDVESLNDAGITDVLYVSGTASYDNEATIPSLPNRVFDPVAAGGYGIARTLTTSAMLPVVADATLLYHAAKLPLSVNHRVVALGLGNNATVIGSTSAAGLSEAPYSSEVARNEYGRFVALYHLASDTNGTAGFQADEYGKAKLVGVIDASGHYFDQAVASASGQLADH